MGSVEMEINFILLIIFIMLAVFWFVNMAEVKMGSHKKAYGMGVLFIIFACVFRIFCIYVDYQHENLSVNTISLAHMVYLSCLMIAYANYGYLMLCILNYHVRWKKAKLYSYFAPAFAAVLLVIISRYTNLIFKVDGVNGYQHGPLHFIIYFVPVFYIAPGLMSLVKRRKYLPANLIKCTVVTMFEFLIGMTLALVTHSKAIIFGMIALIIIIQLFSILFYDNFWDEVSTLLNLPAFEFYIKRYLERNKQMNVVLIQIVGFEYFKNSRDDESVTNMLYGLAGDLKEMVNVNTIYYLSKGVFAVAFDEDDNVDEKDFLDRLITYCNHPGNKHVEMMSPDIDISYIRVPKDVSDPRMLYTYINQKKKVLEIREEKVRFIEKDNLNLTDAYRDDKVLQSIHQFIEDRAFEVYYQPIYDLSSKGFHSAEALIRMNDPKMGFIPPDEFIPLAEKNGMIMEIGSQVFEQVCQFLEKNSPEKYGVSFIEVNISNGQFLDESLLHKLESIMEKHHISHEQLNLEITETETPFEENKMRAQLAKMAEKGFHFSLDDYGTGYSNMEAVTEYPLQMIKLDKSIVWSAFKNSKAMVTMESLVELFHRLGYKIVAEGVETEEMFQKLESIQVDYIQGYYFSKPLPEKEYLQFLAKYMAAEEEHENRVLRG